LPLAVPDVEQLAEHERVLARLRARARGFAPGGADQEARRLGHAADRAAVSARLSVRRRPPLHDARRPASRNARVVLLIEEATSCNTCTKRAAAVGCTTSIRGWIASRREACCSLVRARSTRRSARRCESSSLG